MKQLIFIFLVTTSIYSQTFQTKVFGDFDRNASLVVIAKPSDNNITALIETNLLMEGFNVRSESISSSKKKEISNDLNNSDGVEQKISVSNTNYIKSAYIVETDFSEGIIPFSFPGAPYGVKSIMVKISELSTGKIVAIINKKSNSAQRADVVAKKLVEALLKELK
jgi:hypothetical protein